jgi:recombination associated protein RdgC
MWFKQIQLYQLTTPIKKAGHELATQLESLAFTPCLPSMPSSIGWISPLEEENAPLVRSINGCSLICLQIEEKILPASVIGMALKDKIKQMEVAEGRKIRKKEKLSFKDEVVFTLLPRAFSKITRLYAYIDARNNWLILNTTSPKKAELFISLFKKSLGEGIVAFDIVKPSSIITRWLKNKDYPDVFSIEKSCVLQDPNQQNRMIRAQEQDLFAGSIQDLVKDGCEAIQIALCWQDRLNFTLAEDFTIRSMRRTEDDLAEINEVTESKSEKLDANLFMMTEMFAGLIQDLLGLFLKKSEHAKASSKAA